MKKLHLSRARLKVEFRFYSRLILGYTALFVSIFAFGWLFGKSLETLLIICSYFMTRFAVPKIKHFDTTQKCISISTMTFIFGLAILCIPKEVSMVWSICVGATIPLIMYAESLLFDPVISEEEKIINLCRLHNYGELKTKMAVKFFVYKEKPKDVWLWLCETKKYPMEWDSVKTLKCRMKKDLF